MILPVEDPHPSLHGPRYRILFIDVVHPRPRHWWEVVDIRTGQTMLRSMDFDSTLSARDDARLFSILMKDPSTLLDGWSRQFPGHGR